MLVFPADLEEVEEVGCGGVDGDEVLGWGRRGIGEGTDGEVGRSLAWEMLFFFGGGEGVCQRKRGGSVPCAYRDVLFDLDGPHDECRTRWTVMFDGLY